MTYRFEEEDYRSTYVLEDFYHTHPFIEYNYVVIRLRDEDNSANAFAFQVNFNKTFNPLPDHPRLTDVQTQIAKSFSKNAPDELMQLFKQRVVEAKAYGEKNPSTYLEFEPGNYYNYFELFPRNKEMLDFHYNKDQYFAEDSYDIDPRNDNRSVQLAFYKLELDNSNQPPLLSSTYYLDEALREKEDGKMDASSRDMLIAINQSIPDFNDRLKKHYKEAKKIGQELLKNTPGVQVQEGKVKPNENCPCGSGKKYKKCCALKLN
ncbi:MAG: hypothetical protein HOH38_04450 [Nitrospinaceae bacterium]|nr:hypothetical protein [Nitrospina sp.]MBT5868070.1 hypothetical protein [Nitrospinaceae bacterium]MBT6345110.1 hypothetical protein [Nitrospina sp.]